MGEQHQLGCINNLEVAHLNIRTLKNRSHYIQVKNLMGENDLDSETLSGWLPTVTVQLKIDQTLEIRTIFMPSNSLTSTTVLWDQELVGL